MFGMPLTRHLLSKLSVYVSTALLRYPVQAHYCKSSAVRSLVQRAVLYAYGCWPRRARAKFAGQGFLAPRGARNALFPRKFPEPQNRPEYLISERISGIMCSGQILPAHTSYTCTVGEGPVFAHVLPPTAEVAAAVAAPS